MGHGWKALTLHDRYKISRTSILGEGATAVVYKGLDVKDCRNVAVKLYKYSDGPSSCADVVLQEFRKSVNVLKSLSNSLEESRLAVRRTSTQSFDAVSLHHAIAFTMRPSTYSSTSATSLASSNLVNPVLDEIDTKCCYVKLLDHSRMASGMPGPDEHEQLLFLVMELGDESLEERLRNYRDRGKTLSVEELRELQWALACIVWGLHAVGFVHMDIKPQNIMRFHVDGHDQWKLIDLDGAIETGSDRRLEECTFTPEYMPPELAKAWTTLRKGGPAATITMSRLMDVWSIGMCSLEAIFLQPVLRPWYDEWRKETGCDSKFYKWLADYDTEPILHGDMHDMIAGIDADMCKLLETMLAKDPDKRSSIAECLTHVWFQPEHAKLVGCLRERRQSLLPNLSHTISEKEPVGSRRSSKTKMCAVM
mmetsp:Transcript_11254/g.30623  ORF Transcript_11254/g.30623 Transcript_11254/m.30623 type:complete len:422 (-) Transcript_11254:133-1398(-)|eukprot:CAMPEP_0171217774 /NCGR_PEP_ID=MMETSP0790-20130122/32863_1 /TAXON_ID=2925 /ORGANISM="Alexandrium catenella, Strain OF101" /LENGTH=421 /DNA_ID=CAMNT_0011683583 /DNA_START=22 /DNA_END=1287 /DNA_ORIENTATION=-